MALQEYEADLKERKLYPSEGRERKPSSRHRSWVFSSEEGRQLLEREFLLAGVRIRGAIDDPAMWRPLGYSYLGMGFGSTIVTYRNCPNNAPLALWWGVNESWYPLFPRKTREKKNDLND